MTPVSRDQHREATPQPGLGFVFVMVFLDWLGVGMALPAIPELIRSAQGGGLAEASGVIGVVAAAYALSLALFAPAMGALSDRVGRRPVLLVSMAGVSLHFLALAASPSVAVILAARVLGGVFAAGLPTAHAYVVDVSSPERRARNFGLIGAAFGLALAIGPAVGGGLASLDGRLPFLGAGLLAAGNTVWGWWTLLESLPPDRRRTCGLSAVSPWNGLARLRQGPVLPLLAVLVLFSSLAQRGVESAWVPYTGLRFGWDTAENGRALALVGLMSVLVQGFLAGPAVRRLGPRRLALLSALALSVAYSGFALAENGAAVWAWIGVGSLGALGGPALQAYAARHVPPEQQGRVQGAFASLTGLTGAAAPLLFVSGLGGLAWQPSAILPGAPLLVAAVLMLMAAVLAAMLPESIRELPS